MKKTFKDLKVGDIVYVVYPKNYKDINDDILEYELLETPIIENYTKTTTKYTHDYWGEETGSYSETKDYITIEVLGYTYTRTYSKIYYEHMTMSSNIYEDSPWIEVFANKEDAIDYILKYCNNAIRNNNKTIEKCNHNNYILTETINKYKAYGK